MGKMGKTRKQVALVFALVVVAGVRAAVAVACPVGAVFRVRRRFSSGNGALGTPARAWGAAAGRGRNYTCTALSRWGGGGVLGCAVGARIQLPTALA